MIWLRVTLPARGVCAAVVIEGDRIVDGAPVFTRSRTGVPIVDRCGRDVGRFYDWVMREGGRIEILA